MKKSKHQGAIQYNGGNRRPKKQAGPPLAEIAFSPGLIMRQAAARRRAREAAAKTGHPA